MIININHKMFIKANRLRKASLIIMIMKKIDFIMKMKSMLISSIFISFITIALRFSIQN